MAELDQSPFGELSINAAAHLQSSGCFATSLASLANTGMFDDSSFIVQLASRQVQLPSAKMTVLQEVQPTSTKKNVLHEHFPRFKVRCCLHSLPSSNTRHAIADSI